MHEACRAKFGIATLLAIALGTSAYAETYPERPVRLIVPFAAGGLNDVVARLIAPYLERSLGQPFIVDNRPAASGIVGTDATAKATPDGRANCCNAMRTTSRFRRKSLPSHCLQKPGRE